MSRLPNREADEGAGWDAGDVMPALPKAVPRPAPPVDGPVDPAPVEAVFTPVEAASDDRMPPPPAAPPRALTADEVASAITLASINFRRGRVARARTDIEAVLASNPRSAGAYELLGDIELSESRFDEAAAAFRSALKIEPGRPTAEMKLARAALRQTETARKEAIGVSYVGSDENRFRGSAVSSKRNIGLTVMVALIFPGLGQLVNADYPKGAGFIIGGAICMAVISWTKFPSSAFWIWTSLFTGVLVYAAVDAWITASKPHDGGAK